MASLKRQIVADMKSFYEKDENLIQNYFLVVDKPTKANTYMNNFAVVRKRVTTLTLDEFFELKVSEFEDISRLAYDIKNLDDDLIQEFKDILELMTDNLNTIFNYEKREQIPSCRY